jgi:hypothetical protein
MADTPAIGRQGQVPLAAWVAGPVFGFILLIVIAGQMQIANCGAELTDETAGVVFIVAAGLGFLLTLGLGIWRAARLIRRSPRSLGEMFSRRTLIAIGVAAVLLAGFAVLAPRGAAEIAVVGFFVYIAAGFLGMIGVLFTLVVATTQGRNADEVGSVLAAYLLGCALYVIPMLFLVVSVLTVGCFGD